MMWCIYTMEYYSAIKRMNHAIYSNMDGLEVVILSEVTQRKRNTT